jgi:hypothetical protein
MGEDVLGIALGYPFAIDGLVAGYKDGRFATVIVCDGQDWVITFGYREVGDKI